MQRFETLDGVAALLDRDNIDTDQMLPASFLRGIDPDYGAGLFALWRRDPAFVLSRPGWEQTKILVAGSNFGCGSTREHACWALAEFGIRVLIAGSFGEVFRDNCIKNGILPIMAAPALLDPLREGLRAAPGPVRLQVDLMAQRVAAPWLIGAFDLPIADKTMLVEGLDEIGMSLQHADAIASWERRVAGERPWQQMLRTPV